MNALIILIDQIVNLHLDMLAYIVITWLIAFNHQSMAADRQDGDGFPRPYP